MKRSDKILLAVGITLLVTALALVLVALATWNPNIHNVQQAGPLKEMLAAMLLGFPGLILTMVATT